MNRDAVHAIPRPTAKDLQGADLATIEAALNLEWWRGYHAASESRDQGDRLAASILRGLSP